MNLETKLKEIKARCDGATDGPMVIEEHNCMYHITNGVYGHGRRLYAEDLWGKEDAEFWLHARADVPMLLEMVEFLKQALPPGSYEQDATIELEKITEKYK